MTAANMSLVDTTNLDDNKTTNRYPTRQMETMWEIRDDAGVREFTNPTPHSTPFHHRLPPE